MIRRLVALAALLGVALDVSAINVRLYRPSRMETALAQLRFLQGTLEDGGAARMQQWFPEGYVFMWALYGLAAAQSAEALPPTDARRAELREAAPTAVVEIASDQARSTFDPDMDPPYGAFYAGWSLYVRSVVLRAFGTHAPPPFDLDAYEQDCDRLDAAIGRAMHPFLASYPGMAWPADTAVGVAALAIRDQLRGPRHTKAIDRWIAYAGEHRDPETGGIPHEVDADLGVVGLRPRGESLALMARLLADVDPALARQQYEALRTHYLAYAWGIPGVRVHPRGQTGPGDVDSGPVILGLGGPATVVGAAAALAHGDDDVAAALFATPEMAGLPIEVSGARRYALGLVPVGDAFLAWARSTPSPAAAPGASYAPLFPGWWRVPFQAASVLGIGALASAVLRTRRR